MGGGEVTAPAGQDTLRATTGFTGARLGVGGWVEVTRRRKDSKRRTVRVKSLRQILGFNGGALNLRTKQGWDYATDRWENELRYLSRDTPKKVRELKSRKQPT